jgi:hypothetical protein
LGRAGPVLTQPVEMMKAHFFIDASKRQQPP